MHGPISLPLSGENSLTERPCSFTNTSHKHEYDLHGRLGKPPQRIFSVFPRGAVWDDGDLIDAALP